MNIPYALLVSALLCVTPGVLPSQSTQQQGTDLASGRLVPTTRSGAAKAEFWAGIDDWQNFAFASAVKHFRKATALDPRFGLARVLAAGVDPQSVEEYQANDMQRGVADAARASTAEGLYALAWREKTANNHQRAASLFHAAMEILPNEPHLATEYLWELFAWNPKAGLDSARAVHARFPGFPAVDAALAWFTMSAGGDTTAALAMAEQYLRDAPGQAAPINFYGGIQMMRGHYTEAESVFKRQEH